MSSNYAQWKSLLGFYGENDALNIVRSQGIPLEPSEEESLKHAIKDAVEYVAQISGRKNLKPEIKEIPNEHQQRLAKVQDEPTFKEHLAGIQDHSFGFVEIEKLHCFQPNLNMEYVESLLKKTPEPRDLEETMQFCLPTVDEGEKHMILHAFNPATNSFTLVSENLDLRIIGNMQGEDPVTKRKFVGFVYGFGLRQMSVVNYQGLHMIKNGYHRACALLMKGHKYMPCLIVNTNNYEGTGGMGGGFFGIDLMTSDKSPIVSDFLSKAAVVYPRRRMRVIVSMHAEIQPIAM